MIAQNTETDPRTKQFKLIILEDFEGMELHSRRKCFPVNRRDFGVLGRIHPAAE